MFICPESWESAASSALASLRASLELRSQSQSRVANYEVAFCFTTSIGNLRRRCLVRLQHLCQRRNRREKGAAWRSYSATCRGHQPARISGRGPTAAGSKTGRSSRCTRKLHSKISLRKTSRRSAGCARGSKRRHFAIASSLSGEDRVRREIGRRAGKDFAKAEDNTGADHAHEQYEQHDVAHWGASAHFPPRLRDGDSEEGEPGCGSQSRHVFQAISCA